MGCIAAVATLMSPAAWSVLARHACVPVVAGLGGAIRGGARCMWTGDRGCACAGGEQGSRCGGEWIRGAHVCVCIGVMSI